MILVTLVPGGAPVTKSKTYNLDNELKTVPGSFLFDHLAQFAADFVIQVLITTQLPHNYRSITTQLPLNCSGVLEVRVSRRDVKLEPTS